MVEVQDKGCQCIAPSTKEVGAAIICINDNLLGYFSFRVSYEDTCFSGINELAWGLGKFKDERDSGKYKGKGSATVIITSTNSYMNDGKWM